MSTVHRLALITFLVGRTRSHRVGFGWIPLACRSDRTGIGSGVTSGTPCGGEESTPPRGVPPESIERDAQFTCPASGEVLD